MKPLTYILPALLAFGVWTIILILGVLGVPPFTWLIKIYLISLIFLGGMTLYGFIIKK